MNNRRKYMASVMAVIIFTLGLAIDGQSHDDGSTKRALRGSWRITGTLGPNRPPTSPAIVEALATYDSGGGFVFTDNQPNSPSAHGAWEFAGHRRFNATMVKFIMSPQGQLVATLHVRSRITLNPSDDEYTSEEEVQIRQFPSGALLASYNGATSVAVRIGVEPIE